MTINFCPSPRRVCALCALLYLAINTAPASAQVASPFGFFGGRPAWIVDNPASNYGYNLNDPHPGYYGGGNYREYYAFGRGTGVANFPGPVPGPEYFWDWTAPWRREWILRPPLPASSDPVTPAWGGVVWRRATAPPQVVGEEPGPLVIRAVPEGEPIAQFTIEVPASAELYLEGVKTKQTGPSRMFVSPRLNPGQQYVYEVRARWIENGQPVEQKSNVVVTAGQRLTVRFPQ
jgi:uncharacterized protein (TIGR03000 family)